MAIYHSSGQVIGKSSGRSAVAAAAYRSGSKLTEIVKDSTTGLESTHTWDYSKKGGIEFSAILAPENAPEWAFDREQLWNEVHNSETRKNSQFARDFTIALPCELNAEQNAELLVEIARECFVEHGMIADVNMHYDNPNNPHAHIMLSMRDLVKFDDGKVRFGLKNRSWNDKAFLMQIREQQAVIINKHLEMHGFDARISHLSHRERGIDLEPTIHVGPAGSKMQGSDRQKINDEIIKNNAVRIIQNPELVLDRLSVNKPVFTKEEIAIALSKELLVIRNEQGKIIDSLESQKTKIKALNFNNLDSLKKDSGLGIKISILPNTNGVDNHNLESLNKSLSEVFMVAYLEVLNSKNLSLVVNEDLKGRTLYSLTKRLNLENRYIDSVEALAKSINHNLDINSTDLNKYSKSEQLIEKVKKHAEALDEKLHKTTGFKFGIKATSHNEFSLEQTKAIIEILSGNDLCLLEGLPGTGKTTVLREINRQYKKAGYRVIGAAPSSAAALNLTAKAGIESKNTAQWRKIWQRKKGEEFNLNLKADYFNEESYKQHQASSLGNKDVLIIDEASMVELANMDYLLSEAKKAKAKVILVGDNNQFAAVGMQGALKLASKKTKLSKLKEVRRQINPNHAQATQLLGDYKITEALDIYKQENCFSIYKTEREVKKGLVKDYIDAYLEKAKNLEKDDLSSNKSIVICAFTNQAVQYFNEKVREKLKDAGVVKGKEYEYKFGSKSIKLAVGDQIVFDRNDSSLSVLNGEVATILKCYAPDSQGNGTIKMSVNKADGSCRKINLDTRAYSYNKHSNNFYKQTISHGYAVTAYKLQGATIDQTLVYYEPNVGYEAFNVMMTRHKDQVKLYSSKEILENVVHSKLADNTKEDKEPYITEYDIKSKKDLWAIGLAISVSKRTNLSLSTEYINHEDKLSNEDKTLKTYLESNINLIKTLKIINKDLVREQKKGNKAKITNIWEHESWESVKAYKMARDVKALIICNNYNVYKDKIIRLDLNYETIRRHAGISNYGYKIESVTYRQENTVAHNNNYKELLNLCEEIRSNKQAGIKVDDPQIRGIDNIKVQNINNNISDTNNGLKIDLIDRFAESLQNLKSDLSNSELEIEVTKDQLKNLLEEKYRLEDTIAYAFEYEHKLLPEYLSRIYKNSKEEILNNWLEKVQKKGLTAATKQVKNDPKLLGELVGKGFGSWLGFDYKRRSAIVISAEIPEKLDGLYKIKQAAENARELIRVNNFKAKEQLLNDKIEAISLHLPNKVEHEFINEATKLELSIEFLNTQSQCDRDLKQLKTRESSYKINSLTTELEQFVQSESVQNAFIDYYNVYNDKSSDDLNFEHNVDTQKVADSSEKLQEKSNIETVEHKEIGTKKDLAKAILLPTIDFQKTENIFKRVEEIDSYVNLEHKVDIQKNADSSQKLQEESNVETVEHKEIETKKDSSKASLPSTTEYQKTENLSERIKEINNYISLEDKVDIQKNANSSEKLQEKSNIETVIEHKETETKKKQTKVIPLSITEAAKIEKLLEPIRENNKKEYNKLTSIPKDINKFQDTAIDSNRLLSFAEVKQALSAQHCEQIFRDYSHAINSDGKIIKKGNSISNGSLHMDLKHNTRGLWYRFSTNEKGDIFEFVRTATGSSKYESLRIVAEVAGIEANHNSNRVRGNKHSDLSFKINETKNTNNKSEELENTWIVHSVMPSDAPKFEANKHIAYMLKSNKLIEQYDYKDSDSKLVGLTVRLQDKETGKKQVLPVSYCYNKALGKDEWRLKGFTDSKGLKPIYGLEKIKADLKPILIVEGEKTAGRAQELFPEYSVVSWLGGSNAAKNVNWEQLKAREIIIWPDNDELGKKAASVIAESINCANNYIGRVTIIEPDNLNLPHKWDLGDELPQGLSIKNIKEEISNALRTTKNLDSAIEIEAAIDRQIYTDKTKHHDSKHKEDEKEKKEENVTKKKEDKNCYSSAQTNEKPSNKNVNEHSMENDALLSKNSAQKNNIDANNFSAPSLALAQEKRILWQQKSKGMVLEHNAIKELSNEYSKWNEKLSSNEARYYIRYQEVKEQQSSSHEFLKLEHPLYKDILIEIAKEDSSKFELSNQTMPALINHLQDGYASRVQSYSIKNSQSLRDNALYNQCKQNFFDKDDRIETFDVLLKDALLLHSLQLKNDLKPNADYLDQLISTTHKEVSSYQKPQTRGASSDKLNKDDQVKIAESLYNKINNKEWWQELSNKRIGKYQQEVKQEKEQIDTFLQGHEFKLQEIRDINANYNFDELKNKLLGQKIENREQALDKEWLGMLRPRVSLKIKTLAENKEQAQTIEQVISVLKEEATLTIALHKHPILKQVKEYHKEAGEYLSNMHAAYKNQPNIMSDLERNAISMNKLGLNSEDKIVCELKKTIDIGKSAAVMFKTVQNHHVEDTMKDLKKMKTEDHIIFEGKKFTSPLKYMEYKMHQNSHTSPYLKNSSIEKIYKDLTNYVKIEQQKIKEKSLKLEHELTK